MYKTMQVCSYTLTCEKFKFDFVTKDKTKLNELYDNKGLYSYFTIPKSKKYYIRISYSLGKYMNDMKQIKSDFWIKFILASLLLFSIALFFTFYSLRPIRKALQLNDEFIKDILHDFNTPITAMILNMKMFKDDYGKNSFINKIALSIDNILLLQNNLKSFLHHSPTHIKKIDIALVSKKRLEFMQNMYPKLHFKFEKNNTLIKVTNEEIFIRILDNILSNAAKYNKVNGEVLVTVIDNLIKVKDTGKGIKSVDKVMQRYYKEQDRGLGLGLHIVQKLTKELNIEINIHSLPKVGTTVILDFKHLTEG